MGLENMWGFGRPKAVTPEKMQETKDRSERLIALSDEEFQALAEKAGLNEAEREAMQAHRRIMPQLEASQERSRQGIFTEVVEAVKNGGLPSELHQHDMRDYASAFNKLKPLL